MPPYTPQQILDLRHENPELRDRDLADQFGIAEAQLVAARTGAGVIRINAHPDRVIPAAMRLGEVMALTRNLSCVHENVGTYANYHPGAHAAMVLTQTIDLRIFPLHWVHGFLVTRETAHGPRRSLQIFDAAGDAVHKIHLRDTSDLAAWEGLASELAVADQSPDLLPAPRVPVEAARSNPDKLDILRKEWARLTDTHQFLRLVSKLRMNRLGAYRIAGHPFVRQLEPGALEHMLSAVAARGTEVMIFTGNSGCIQIHSGPVTGLKPVGAWQNILQPGFNLHLRRDRIAELWAVEKPTQRGPAISVEAFDAEGALITQIFAVGKEGHDFRPEWRGIVAALESLGAGGAA